MVSGKYSAVAGAVSREQAIANIANNLANVSTTGYKRSLVSFESILRGEQQSRQAKGINYNRVRVNATDFSPGPMRQTENPLDLAIHEQGFFKLQGPNGLLYTRRGDFTIDAQGILRSNNGMAVLDGGNAPIAVPDTDIGQIAIAENGTLSIITPDGGLAEVAQIAIVDIDDRSRLQRETDTTFSLLEGGNEVALDNPTVIQGSLELANVNMAEEMTRMINSYRTFETYHKVLEGYSTLGQQQDELGTLS